MTNANRRRFLTRVAAGGLAVAGTRSARAWASNADRIKIGLIGTKHSHARGKLATLLKMDDAYDLVGVVEPDDAQWRREKETPEYRDVHRMTERELLASPGLEAAVVETDVDQLVPTAQRCADAGLHVHLEKPAGESLDDFRDVLDAATQRKRVVQMGYMFRYNPAFQLAFKVVREGWLGRVFEVHGVMSKMVNDATREELARFTGGSMYELGCHLIDALHVVMGRPTNVTAFPRQTREDNLRDNCLAVFEYPRATATIRSAVVEVDGFRRRQFVICGDEGTIDIRPLEVRGDQTNVVLTLDRPRGDYRAGRHELSLPLTGGRYDGDFLDLADIIRGRKAASFDPEHDLAVQESVLRASGLPAE
ncbi:MAG: Gfo/Idh/MocA family oxidoreductase [Planctomycetota bacterium]